MSAILLSLLLCAALAEAVKATPVPAQKLPGAQAGPRECVILIPELLT